jgi:hypothetical protein
MRKIIQFFFSLFNKIKTRDEDGRCYEPTEQEEQGERECHEFFLLEESTTVNDLTYLIVNSSFNRIQDKAIEKILAINNYNDDDMCCLAVIADNIDNPIHIEKLNKIIKDRTG